MSVQNALSCTDLSVTAGDAALRDGFSSYVDI